jgi:hypothetical protein
MTNPFQAGQCSIDPVPCHCQELWKLCAALSRWLLLARASRRGPGGAGGAGAGARRLRQQGRGIPATPQQARYIPSCPNFKLRHPGRGP